MPHKHKRDKSQNKTTTDLPPTTLAKPLPATKPSKPPTVNPKPPSSKRKRPRDATDDTPRAFARLMAFHTSGIKPPAGLDDGVRPTKKNRKLITNSTTTPTNNNPKTHPTTTTIPKLLPNERLSDFSARVNAALPLANLINKGKKLDGLKERKTKTEKRMQRMQAEWREVEARRKEKEEEARDEAFVAESDEGNHNGDAGTVGKGMGTGTGKGKKKGKKRTARGGAANDDDDNDDDDPWATIAAKRKEESSASVNSGLIGLHDVVLAPPQFSKPPRERFKVRNGAGVRVGDVPRGAGSLRRREELGVLRKGVVDGYRMLRGRGRGV